jgi:hypothetical protein
MRADAMVRRTERWFIRQGVPHLIADYRFRTHVLPRMVPFLAAVIVIGVLFTGLLARVRPGVAAVVATSVLLAGLLAVPVAFARMGRRLPRWSRTGATSVLIAYGLTPLLIPVLLLGAYGRTDIALRIGRPGAPTLQVAAVTGLVLAIVFVAVFAVAWFATAYGLVPLAARAVQHALRDMRGSFQMQGRALPALLFVTFFLFFTGELWQLMNHLEWGRLVLVLVLFASVTVLATSARLGSIPTPSPPPALTARQETNVLLVLATRQLIQAAVVGLGLFTFFVVLGLVVVDDETAALWIGEPPRHSAWVPFMPVALFRAAVLLAGFGSMYFAVTAMTQEEYRREFFEPVVEDVERTLAVRAVYLDVRRGRFDVPDTAPDEA